MSVDFETAVCEECGATAEVFVKDMIETTEPGDKWRRFDVESVHYFCQEHDRKAQINTKPEYEDRLELVPFRVEPGENSPTYGGAQSQGVQHGNL